MSSKFDQMWDNLRDLEFRKQFIDEHVNVGISFQIRSLRNRQKLTQSDLARLLDVKQPLVSSWENPNYGKYSLKTLKDLAKAFDVGLLVRFVPFSKLVDWTVNLVPDVIAPPSFGEEEQCRNITPPNTTDISNAVQGIRHVDANLYSLEPPTTEFGFTAISSFKTLEKSEKEFANATA